MPRRRRRYASRKAVWLAAALLLAGAAGLADRAGIFGRAKTPDTQKYDGKTFRVVKVVDGDTLDVNVPDGKDPCTRIRLWGVDTPEVHPQVQHFGRQASARTKQLAMDQAVRLELEPRKSSRDKYGRLLAFVHLPDGRLLNATIIEEGYGYADPRFDHSRKKHFSNLQKTAMSQRLGLWRDVRHEDLPKYYRQQLKLPR